MDKSTTYASLGTFGFMCLFVFGLAVTDSITATTGPVIATVLGTGGIIVTGVLTSRHTDSKVEAVDRKVERVLNGEMDSKIQTVLVETLDNSVIDPAVRSHNDDSANVTEP